ncbi:CrcB family protein [Halorussus sp. MSC15.2]|uniref:fluoride efflux transporter FluC n=1 Tax=Halorussus sp. MSC15.2 TaxID=2283638 RepID=UPI0013CF7A8D|nr:CrcB family protein [Halorussus sp. MSC15.2]NEU57960.1 CrcB family protein [Halorussus sp. MSC15.2]
MNTALLVGVGGVLGALSRFAVGSVLSPRTRSTLAVNVLGSFALGALTVGLADGTALLSVFGIGFCGAFTTFSSFAVETVELYEGGAKREAVENAAVNLVGALVAVVLGGWVATVFN